MLTWLWSSGKKPAGWSGQEVGRERPEPDAQAPLRVIDAVHVAAQERALITHDHDDGVLVVGAGEERLHGRPDLRVGVGELLAIQVRSGTVSAVALTTMSPSASKM